MVLARTGHDLPEYERGVSVFPAAWSPTLGRWFVPETHGWAASLGDLASSDRPIYLLTGRVVGEGTDGEPLLRRSTVTVVKRLKRSDVYAQGNEYDESLWIPFMSSEERDEYEAVGAELDRLREVSIEDLSFAEQVARGDEAHRLVARLNRPLGEASGRALAAARRETAGSLS